MSNEAQRTYHKISMSLGKDIGQFLREWKEKYENRVFDFSNPNDQEDFHNAMSDMVLHIAHTSKSAKLTTLIEDQRVKLIYTNVTQS